MASDDLNQATRARLDGAEAAADAASISMRRRLAPSWSARPASPAWLFLAGGKRTDRDRRHQQRRRPAPDVCARAHRLDQRRRRRQRPHRSRARRRPDRRRQGRSSSTIRPNRRRSSSPRCRANDLVEKTADGLLPRVAADGTRPLDAYARPSDTDRRDIRIAIVVGGFGIDPDGTTAGDRHAPRSR